MKKIISSMFLFGATTFAVFAQTATTTAMPVAAVTPVSAGLTPESPFYFLDKITEALQGLIAFTPDAKVKLQLSFAAERVAEAKAMLALQGDHKTGLDVVHASLVENVQKTADILKSEKLAGRDVTALAKEANTQFDSEERDLNNTLSDAHKEIFGTKIEESKKALEEAKASKDETKIKDAEQNLQDNKQIAEDLKTKKEEIKKSFHEEKKSVEEEMSKDDQEKDKIDSEKENMNDSEDETDFEKEDMNDSEDETDSESENKDNTPRSNTQVRDTNSNDNQGEGQDVKPDGRR